MESWTLHKLSTLSTYSFCIVRTLHNPIKTLWRVWTLHNFFAYVIKCMLYLKKVFFCVPGLGGFCHYIFTVTWFPKKQHCYFFVLSTDFIREKWINIILVTTKVYERHFCLDQKKGYVHGATKKFVHATACYFCIRNFLI